MWKVKVVDLDEWISIFRYPTAPPLLSQLLYLLCQSTCHHRNIPNQKVMTRKNPFTPL